MRPSGSSSYDDDDADRVKDGITAFSQSVEDQARALGFCAFGITSARPDPARTARLDQWLAEGMHGTMTWMEERAHHRRSPEGLWPEARSVIALGMSYAPASDPLRLADENGIGRISTYAQGADYHDTVKKALKHLARWIVSEGERQGLGPVGVKVFTDTAPVMEKPLAAAAGLGWQGKHTNMVSREHGSWLFLGEIYTTLDLPPSTPGRDRCGSCRACQDACPTDAFPAPYRLDARRCVSYLTIEHKGPVPEDLREGLGNRIYGCDDCLAVCPWNKFAATARRMKAFLPRAELTAPDLADLLTLDDTGFRALFSGSPIKRIGRDRFVRNCLYAAGNSGRSALLEQVEALLADPDPGVADAARWACDRLRSSPPSADDGEARVRRVP
ncbi:tRNA epoxyqueuosine(34) reductase QueG [Novosphingobium panipatense]|jgi:epoxyqueuosine reductase|uniref:tRNA epoxyqueuosine(34) reductase QueG n=1 Tax=Novosphingobium TaxID=165696 RepID=UPI000CDB585B|nr:tRNA epoxyqueuosine(34) reductase QueG [Novosphingobium sp. HII-3]